MVHARMKMKHFHTILLSGAMLVGLPAFADLWLTDSPQMGDFLLAHDGQVADLLLDQSENRAVGRALRDLRSDVRRVTGLNPGPDTVPFSSAKRAVIVGTIGKSWMIDHVVAEGKLNTNDIAG